ncbi:hypothetical protein QT381_05910 [Galbitalea sp. SE-J8]|uniref:hypothetical protein n=1 Tax=Galbitalea sp. SE-J8 TaxID=3054952 RepID=UPI00259CD3F7|nr:hypothetical protein [Galbitalea sp. SE-J8]MDM4762536.1 hypothetical protein [Galbitalea sp. SE-J8]
MRAVLTDVRRSFASPWAIVSLVFLASPFLYASTFHYYSPAPVYRFADAVNGPLVIAYPVIAMLVFVAPFLAEWRHGFVRLTATRVEFSRYVRRKFAANAIAVFIVFALVGALPAIWFLVVDPALALTDYPTASEYGGTITSMQQFGRLTDLWLISPALYITAYAVSSGLTGALLSSVGFLTLFLVRSRFLAIITPLLLFVVQAVVFFSQGWDLYTFYFAFEQFGVSPASDHTLVVPLALLAVIVAAQGLVLRARREPLVAAIA